MSAFSVRDALRPNIAALVPYRCARDDYEEGILLDANENSVGPCIGADADVSGASAYDHAGALARELKLERYPDPHQTALKNLLVSFRNRDLDQKSCSSSLSELSPANFFCGVGSDEVIDIVIRIFVAPAREKILVCPPTYGMSSVCANINDVGIVKVPLLLPSFQVDTSAVVTALETDNTIKVVFLCSPGNPTGTLLRISDIVSVAEVAARTNTVVVVDEAYIDFAQFHVESDLRAGKNGCNTTIGAYPENNRLVSATHLVGRFKNVIVSQTLSKSFGLAGIRLGIAIGDEELISYMSRTKAPYNISSTTSLVAQRAVEPAGVANMESSLQVLHANKRWLESKLLSGELTHVKEIVGGSHANFVLVRLESSELATRTYLSLAEEHKVVVRDRTKEPGCEGCLRITVGTAEENNTLISALKKALAKTD